MLAFDSNLEMFQKLHDEYQNKVLELEKQDAEIQETIAHYRRLVENMANEINRLNGNYSPGEIQKTAVKKRGNSHTSELLRFLTENSPKKYTSRQVKMALEKAGVDFASPNPIALVSRALQRLSENSELRFEKNGKAYQYYIPE